MIKTWGDAVRRESLGVCLGQSTVIRRVLRPGHIALYGLITAKTRQKVISREADDIVRVDVEFKTSYSRFIDVAGHGKKSERRRTRQKVLNCSKFVARGQTRVAHVVKTCITRETHAIIRVPAVIKTWGDAVRRESLGNSHGQSTVIGRMLRVGITGNSVCLAACHWQIYFSVLRQCLGSASAVEQPPTAIPRHKARPSQNWPKITTYDHVHKIFITSCTWFRHGVLCDRGFTPWYHGK